MAVVFGDRGRVGVLYIFRAAGAGNYSRKWRNWHNRAHHADRAASGDRYTEPGIPGFEINNYIAVAARPGGSWAPGSVHRAIGQKKKPIAVSLQRKNVHSLNRYGFFFCVC